MQTQSTTAPGTTATLFNMHVHVGICNC